MRVFVDVGAHYGETLEVALDPSWGFDRIFAIEPASACHSLLKKFRDPRLVVEPIALGATNSTAILYGAGLLGGSLFRSKKQKARPEEVRCEKVEVRRAGVWLRSSVPEGADLFIKLNCEGSECDIIDDLLEAGLASQLRSLYIDFDVRKVPDQAHRQAETESRLRRHGIRYETPATLGSSGNAAIARWLWRDCPRRQAGLAEQVRYRLGLFAPLYLRIRFLARFLLPRPIFFWAAQRYGRMSRASRRN